MNDLMVKRNHRTRRV